MTATDDPGVPAAVEAVLDGAGADHTGAAALRALVDGDRPADDLAPREWLAVLELAPDRLAIHYEARDITFAGHYVLDGQELVFRRARGLARERGEHARETLHARSSGYGTLRPVPHPDGADAAPDPDATETEPIYLHHARDGKHHVSTPLGYLELDRLAPPPAWESDPRDNTERIEHEVFTAAPADVLDAIPQEDVRRWVDEGPLLVGTLTHDGERLVEVEVDDVDDWTTAAESESDSESDPDPLATDGGQVAPPEFEAALAELATDVRNVADRIEGILRDVREGAIDRAEARRRVAEELDAGVDPREVLQEGES